MFVSLRSGLFVTDVFWWHVMSLATTSRSDAPTIYAWNGQIYRGSIALPPLEDGRINCGWIWGNARRHNPITGLGETREIRRRPEILSLNIRLLKPRNARKGFRAFPRRWSSIAYARKLIFFNRDHEYCATLIIVCAIVHYTIGSNNMIFRKLN